MFKKIKKHFNKILIACLTLISSIAIFSSINKTYAYTTNQFSYTISNIYDTENSQNVELQTINNVNGFVYSYTSNYTKYLLTNSYNNFTDKYFLINYYLLDTNTNTFIYSSYGGSFTIGFNLYYLRNSNTLEYVNVISGQRLTSNYANNYLFTTIGKFAITTNYNNNLYLNISGLNNFSSNYVLFITNIDIVESYDIGIQQYYETYYGQIEDNYNQLLSDYNDLQDNYDSLNDDYLELNEQYDDLNNDLQDLQGQYDDLEVDYQNLQNNYDTLDDSLSHNVINELVGNNYFTKSNIQLLQNENYFEHNDFQINPYGATTQIYAMISNYIDNKTLYIGSALEWVSNNNFYNIQNYNSSYFTWLNLVPYYNYSSSMVTSNGVSRWDSTSSVNPLCKYVNLSIISSRDILIEVVIKDSFNNFIYQTIERDSNTGNYLISFDNDDERVFSALRLQCKLSNGVYYTADRIISYTGNITDNQYELGFQNGSVSSQATINALNNDIRDLNEQITTANLTIESLKEQISSISSDYNLNNLIWAIGGTPFESFKQIWNVDFFGVNIAEVITGFLTALIALYVIKKFFK